MIAATTVRDNVATATGPVPATALGRVLVGESVFRGLPGSAYFESPGELPSVARRRAAETLVALRESGVETIVDATPIDHGRDPELVQEAAEASQLNVVLGVGVCSGAAGPPAAFAQLQAEELAEVYIRELAGTTRSGIRAAVIAVEVGTEVTAFDQVAALAVSFAHAETGAPVLARAGGATRRWIVDRLVGRGVEPDRILLAGVDSAGAGWTELDALAKLGVRLGVTGIGGEAGLTDEARASLLAYLLRTVGDARVCLSMSSWACWLGAGGLSASSRVAPDRGFAALNGFRELSSVHGVTAERFDQVLRNGAAAWLGG